MGEFRVGEAQRVARKAEELAPYIAAAFERKKGMAPIADSKIEPVIALGRQIAQKSKSPGAPERMTWREALRRGEEDKASEKPAVRITEK
jgi:hypothetical protein